jgi:selenocysteine lyase/cysteine desulfurase
VPALTLHGPAGPGPIGSKVGVIPFTVDGLDHGLVAAVLGYEHGVGVRSGCFCAHPYIAHLLRLSATEMERRLARARGGEHRGTPGMVRISFGCYNDLADVDRAVGALELLAAGQIEGTYRARSDGSFVPDGHAEPMLFDLDDRAVGTWSR